MKRCTICKLPKPEDQFSWRNRAKGIRQNYCKSCKSEYNKTWYATHADEQKARAAKIGARRRAVAIEVVRAAKNVPCTDCGRTFPPCAMDFDHLDGQDKLWNVARMLNHNLDLLRAEIAKCEVVCACCHRIRTSTRLA